MNMEQIRNPHLIYPGQVLYLEKIDGRARLRVTNDAPELDAGQVPRLFDRFYRATAARSLPGSGLGTHRLQTPAAARRRRSAASRSTTASARCSSRWSAP